VSALLDIVGVSKRFGGLTAVKDVSFKVEAGQICSLMGRTAPARRHSSI